MGRPGISKVEVVRAYVSLMRQGREPSLQNLRLEIGRGSFSTIAAHVASLALAQKGVSGRQARRARGTERRRADAELHSD
jgi:hypothetical protein